MRGSTGVDEEFTSFVASASPQLHRKAWLLTTSSAAAEDLLQTALAKAYVHWRRVSAADDPTAYVSGIVLKTFLSDRRRRSSTEVAVAEVDDVGTEDDDPALRADAAGRAPHARAARPGGGGAPLLGGPLRGGDRPHPAPEHRRGEEPLAARPRHPAHPARRRARPVPAPEGFPMSTHDTAPLPGSDEAYVREVLDSAMSGTRPPLDLPSAALTRGRRLRTRRRS